MNKLLYIKNLVFFTVIKITMLAKLYYTFTCHCERSFSISTATILSTN